ncbi:MAG: tyrosine-type recombinase/integrase [Candidatus Hodarchaeales archaeon]|jgi:site-specific recombinase XerD
MGKIKEKMKQEMELRGLSELTQEAYLACIKQYVKYFMKSPDKLNLDDIHAYQLHLVRERKVAENTFNQHVAAIKFLYGMTLKRNWKIELIPYHKRRKRLPVVLSRQEVVQLYKAVRCIKHQAMILTLYSTGMRVSELTHLKISDIDSKRMVIRIDQGKNRKDRYVRLSEKLLKTLRLYWLKQKPKLKTWLFPGYDVNSPITRNSVLRMVAMAGVKAGIKKPVTTHTVRHTYATHQLESGMDIRKIQLMLGHRSLRTTAIYLHVASNYLNEAKTPLDTLDLN